MRESFGNRVSEYVGVGIQHRRRVYSGVGKGTAKKGDSRTAVRNTDSMIEASE
jgi:hypothetical protein